MLTPRETQILQLAANGLTYAEIGAELHNAHDTVKQILGRVYRKLGARNGTHAVALAIGAGLITAPAPTEDMRAA